MTVKFDAPTAAYLIPLLGLLMAPIYPVINSVALSSLPKPMHAAMTGLIVVFSALGGTLGSYITARVFASFDGIHAFYFSLVPMGLVLVTLFFFKRSCRKNCTRGISTRIWCTTTQTSYPKSCQCTTCTISLT